MATTNLALVGVANNTATLVNYTLRSCNDKAVQYVGQNSDDSLAAPRLLDVKLAIKSPGIVGNDRVEISFKHVVLDADNLPHTGSATLTISMPRVSQWTTEYTVSLLKQIADYASGVAATVSGQTDTSSYPGKWAEALIP
jgi:hypothetical protein